MWRNYNYLTFWIKQVLILKIKSEKLIVLIGVISFFALKLDAKNCQCDSIIFIILCPFRVLPYKIYYVKCKIMKCIVSEEIKGVYDKLYRKIELINLSRKKKGQVLLKSEKVN